MLDSYEKGFDMEKLNEFFGKLKEELVPFLKKVMDSGVEIRDEFLTGAYPEEKQQELAHFLAEYVGFDFTKCVKFSCHHFVQHTVLEQSVRFLLTDFLLHPCKLGGIGYAEFI